MYDNDCDPVIVNNKPVHCLMWADDCVVMSTSANGLQRSIDKTVNHFTELGLSLNTKPECLMMFHNLGTFSQKT